jgi:hypothetical protein
MMTILALLLAGSLPAADRDDPTAVRAACAAPVGARPAIKGLRIEAIPAAAGDLAFLRISDAASGGWMRLYYDAGSERAAWARAACLGAQIRLLAQETGGAWRNAHWSAVVMTRDATYAPPIRDAETRWPIRVQPDGTIDSERQRSLIETIPHEQVHAFQGRAGAITPRWFHEGHAEWIARKVTAIIDPERASAQSAGYAAKLRGSTTPVALGAWGGLRVKPEAILRQLSPADRRRKEADPGFVPPGPFSFGPDDMVSDESNTGARYEAAWRLFAKLEAERGSAAVRDWVNGLTAKSGRLASDAIVADAATSLKADLAPQLR